MQGSGLGPWTLGFENVRLSSAGFLDMFRNFWLDFHVQTWAWNRLNRKFWMDWSYIKCWGVWCSRRSQQVSFEFYQRNCVEVIWEGEKMKVWSMELYWLEPWGNFLGTEITYPMVEGDKITKFTIDWLTWEDWLPCTSHSWFLVCIWTNYTFLKFSIWTHMGYLQQSKFWGIDCWVFL